MNSHFFKSRHLFREVPKSVEIVISEHFKWFCMVSKMSPNNSKRLTKIDPFFEGLKMAGVLFLTPIPKVMVKDLGYTVYSCIEWNKDFYVKYFSKLFSSWLVGLKYWIWKSIKIWAPLLLANNKFYNLNIRESFSSTQIYTNMYNL